MYEFYDLNLDELDKALQCALNMMQLKEIEELLYPEGLNHIYAEYYSLPGYRDFDCESYNNVQESTIGIMFLDAIFESNFKVKSIYTDEDISTYEELYYKFRVPKDHRYDGHGLENLCQSYSVLSLYSDGIKNALKVADGNSTVLGKILAIAHGIEIGSGDLYESATIDLLEGTVDILLSEYSMYEIEHSVKDLLRLEHYCREVVDMYG